MITRISLIPFDIGGSNISIHRNSLEAEGFTESRLQDMDKRLIGLDVSRWESNDDGINITLYLERRGFGVLVYRESTEARFGDHSSIADLLEQRWQFHNEVIQGTSSISKKVDALRMRVRKEFGCTTRWDSWEKVLYVFTFYVAEEDPDQILDDRDSQLGIIALSEPSRVGLGDTEEYLQDNFVVNWPILSRISGLDPIDMPHDIETNKGVFCGVTWASLIIACRSNHLDSTVNIYELLEVRTQIIWSLAHQIRRWCERQLAYNNIVELSELNEVRGQVIPLLYEARQISEASLSTRHANILETLKHASGLEHEIEAAENALQLTYEFAEAIKVRRAKRYETAVKVLLGVIAVFQLTALIHDGPLLSLSTLAATAILVGVGAATTFLVVRDHGE